MATSKEEAARKAADVGGGKSSLQSAVTTDLPPGPGPSDGDVTVDLTKVKLPASAVEQPAPAPAADLTDDDLAEFDARDRSYEQRAIDAMIGLVNVDGIGVRYVGLAPAQEKEENRKTPSGTQFSMDNATFTPLANVPFNPSHRIKDPTTGEFYYPSDGVNSWEGCELNGNPLIPREPNKKAAKARKQAAIDARNRG
jgi:hypothetical protein